MKGMSATKVRTIDDAGHRLVLRERAGFAELVTGNVVLLSSAALGTERAFGRRVTTLGRHAPTRVLRVLIGGLGFGATLRGALDVLSTDARVVVAEKVGAVETLVRGDLAHLAEFALDDPRVTLVHDDVFNILARATGEFDAVLLDVDNGPHWATFRSNARLYSPAGLAAAFRALTQGGALAVWSGYRADAFLAGLRTAGFAPTVIPLHERGRVRARAYVGTRV
jgi:spermidine synthase